MKKMFFYIVFNYILFELFKITNTTIILDIKSLPKENYIFSNENTTKSIIKKHYHSDVYTSLKIGIPSQEIPFLISINKNKKNSITGTSSDYTQYSDISPPVLYNITPLFIKNSQLSFFNEKKSSNFSQLSEFTPSESYPKDYDQSCIANDTMNFYNNIDLNKKIENVLMFELIKNPREYISGELALSFPINSNNKNCFLTQLKKNNLIKNYTWFFLYDKWSSDNGKLIIGTTPHELFPKKYKAKDLIYTNSLMGISEGNNWKIEFNYITIGEERLSNLTAELIFDSDLIIAPRELEKILLNNFLESYINDKKCFVDNFYTNTHYTSTVKYYYCEKDLKNSLMKQIPKINFNSKDFNYTFELNSDSFFVEENEFVFLKIIFILGVDTWLLGKPFSLKYQFVFNPDTRQFGMYNPDFEYKKNSSLKKNFMSLVIIVILCVIFTVLGVILGKKIYGLRRKQKANELNDDFEYISAAKLTKDIKKTSFSNYKSIEMNTSNLY